MIDLNRLDVDYAKLAFDMFRKWSSNASQQYPEKMFSVLDERVLVEDLREAITEAVSSCQEKPGKSVFWRTGFIRGYIQGNLNRRWYSQYIKQQSEEYRQLTALHAIRSLLEFDETILQEATTAYNILLREGCNLKTVDNGIKQKTLHIPELDVEFEPTSPENNPVFIAINNLMLDNILETEGGSESFLEDVAEFFDDDIVDQLMELGNEQALN